MRVKAVAVACGGQVLGTADQQIFRPEAVRALLDGENRASSIVAFSAVWSRWLLGSTLGARPTLAVY